MRRKKAKRNVPKKIAKTLDIPEDVMLGSLRLTMMSNRELRIENYKSILEYETDKITLNTKDMLIAIGGEKLDIGVICDDEILVTGEISSLEFSKIRS